MFELSKRWFLILMGVLVPAAGAQISTTPLTFPAMTTVGASSQPVTVSLTAQSSGVLTSLAALTGGSPNQDFAVASTTCVINPPFNTGNRCTVSLVFSPRYPGVRQVASSRNPAINCWPARRSAVLVRAAYRCWCQAPSTPSPAMGIGSISGMRHQRARRPSSCPMANATNCQALRMRGL